MQNVKIRLRKTVTARRKLSKMAFGLGSYSPSFHYSDIDSIDFKPTSIHLEVGDKTCYEF